MLWGNCEGARAHACVSSVCHGRNVLAFFCLNRVTCFSIQSLLQSQRHTHTHKESGRRVQYCRPLLLPLKMWVFFPLSPRLPGRGTLPFVSKGTLFIFPSLILFLPHSPSTKSESARGRSLSPGPGGPQGRLGHKGARKTEKGDVSMCLYSHVLCSFPLTAV